MATVMLSIISLGVCFMFNVHNVAYAQDQCDGPDNINIKFPEVNPPSVPDFKNDQKYTQKILGGLPRSVEVEVDPKDTKPIIQFSDKFHVVISPSLFGERGVFVQMKAGIDRDGATNLSGDDINILQYQVKCAAGSNVRFKVLKIEIYDINDNRPQFIQSVLNVEVNEVTPVGLTVIDSISATDNDSGSNAQINYSLSKADDAQFDGTSYFAFQSANEGIITVTRNLDFEEMYQLSGNDANNTVYKMIVTATDGGTPPLSSTMTLNIKIVDNDDLGPAFEYPSCITTNQATSKPCIQPEYTTSVTSDVSYGGGSAASMPNTITTNVRITHNFAPSLSCEQHQPSCGPSNQATGKLCIQPEYTTSVISDNIFVPVDLTLLPRPADRNNMNLPVDMIMYDRDTQDHPVSCSIVNTIPNGYQTFFRAAAQQISDTKKYKCTISQVRSISRSLVSEVRLIVEAAESSSNKRLDYATVFAAVNPRVPFAG